MPNQTPPMPDKTEYVCPTCKNETPLYESPDGRDGIRCPTCKGEGYIALTPPTEPQEVEALDDMAIRDEINRLRRERGNHLMDEPQYVDAISAIIARETTAAVEAFAHRLKADEPLSLDHLNGYIDEQLKDYLAELAAQQKGEQ